MKDLDINVFQIRTRGCGDFDPPSGAIIAYLAHCGEKICSFLKTADEDAGLFMT